MHPHVLMPVGALVPLSGAVVVVGGVFAAFSPVVRRSARFWGCGAAGFSLSCSLSAPCCGRSVPEPLARFSVAPAFTKELTALRAASRSEQKQGEGSTCASVSAVIHWGMQGGRST